MNAFILAQIIVSVLLTTVILLQSQGSSGLGSTFGGSGSPHTRRGIEKTLLHLTIVLLVLFTGLSVLALV